MFHHKQEKIIALRLCSQDRETQRGFDDSQEMKGNVSHEAKIEQSAILLILRLCSHHNKWSKRKKTGSSKRESDGKHIQMTLHPSTLKANTRGWLES